MQTGGLELAVSMCHPPVPPMRKASIGTIFLTVFLDLLGFGLVVPFLPQIAREFGATSSMAPLVGTVYSLMQFLLIPIWGRLSDRVGRRPVLLWSIAAAAVGMSILGFASALWMVFFARIWSGAATANLAVAQAYIADVTTPENRARGMGVIGVAFGLGFVLGPFVGGELGTIPVFGRPGPLAAFAAAGLSTLNFFLALRFLPESLPPERRGKDLRSASPFELRPFREAAKVPGLGTAFVVQFILLFAFSGMEQTFSLFTSDAFHMNAQGTGRVLGFVGVIMIIVQGAAIRPLTRRFGETNLIRVGVVLETGAFVLLGRSPNLQAATTALFLAAGIIAVGSGLVTPSVSSYVSRRSDRRTQGTTLGAFQSLGALGRVFGPAAAGAAYGVLGRSGTYYVAAGQLAVAALLTMTLQATLVPPPEPASAG